MPKELVIRTMSREGVFGTTRTNTGIKPEIAFEKMFGVTTFELG
jgi:hypothetical protein